MSRPFQTKLSCLGSPSCLCSLFCSVHFYLFCSFFHRRRPPVRALAEKYSSELSSSRDCEHDLALSVPAGGSFLRLAGIRQRKRTVNGDANRAGIKQASHFRELWPVRAHLG